MVHVNIQVQSLLEESERGLAVHYIYRCLRSLLRNQLFAWRLKLCFGASLKKPSITSFQEYNSYLNVPTPRKNLRKIVSNIPRRNLTFLPSPNQLNLRSCQHPKS